MTSARHVILAHGPVSEPCLDELQRTGLEVLQVKPLDTLSEAVAEQFLIKIRKGADIWWEIGWRASATGVVDGPWRYAEALADAEPIAWCRLPAARIEEIGG